MSIMVNFNSLVNNTAPNAKNASAETGAEGAAPNSGFAALFAALQPHTSQLEQAPSAAQLQQLAQGLNTREQEQLLEESELSPEAIAQILAQLQQQQALQQPQGAASLSTHAAQQTVAGAVGAQLHGLQMNAVSAKSQQQAAVVNTTNAKPAVNAAQLAKTSDAASQLAADALQKATSANDARLNASAHNAQTKPLEPVQAELKPQQPLASFEGAKTAQPAPAPTLTASVVMVDAPVAQAQAAAATPSTTAATGSLAAPVGSQAWANQLQQNVMQMVMHNQNEMTLRLHPAELGPLQVQLRMDDTTAQLNILTHSQHVRGALEQALPTLREALANQGIQLGESNVNDQNQQFAQQQARQQAQQWAANSQNNGQNTDINPVENAESAENTDMGLNSRHTAAAHNGQVDTFA